MTMTNQLPQPLWAGTAITTTCVFSVPVYGEAPADWPPVDPSTVQLIYIPGTGASPVTWTYGGVGSIVRVSEGVYSAELNTSGTDGRWQVKWVGTGACAAVSIAGFPVEPAPF